VSTDSLVLPDQNWFCSGHFCIHKFPVKIKLENDFLRQMFLKLVGVCVFHWFKSYFLFFKNLISKKAGIFVREPFQTDGEPPLCEKWRMRQWYKRI